MASPQRDDESLASISSRTSRRKSFVENVAEVYRLPQEDEESVDEEIGASVIASDCDRDTFSFDRDLALPQFKIESDSFQLPENLLLVQVKPSHRQQYMADSISNLSRCPLYLVTSFDEFSRDFCIMTVGENLAPTIPIIDYNPDFSHAIKFPDLLNESFEPFFDDEKLMRSTQSYFRVKPTRILHHYHPGYNTWNSNFRVTLPDLKSLFIEKPISDTNILLKISSCTAKNSFEPLFGSLALYLVRNDELIRLSESFHFDITPDPIKEKYTEVYRLDLIPGSDVNPLANAIKTCLFRVPEDLQRDQDLYIVITVSKVLSGDTDKSVAPYLRGAAPALSKHEEQCNRLALYRQLVGLGIVKVFDENGCVGVHGKPGLSFKLYAHHKKELSEAQLLAVRSSKTFLLLRNCLEYSRTFP